MKKYISGAEWEEIRLGMEKRRNGERGKVA